MKLNNYPHRIDYFIYHGVAYGVGTKVILSDEFASKYSYKRKNIPHIFTASYSDGYNIFYMQDDGTKSCLKSSIGIDNYDEDIKEIVYPVYANIQHTSWQKQAINNMMSGKFHADIFDGVVIYLAVMVVGAIFKDRWLLWIAATIIFINWVLNQYRS